MTGNDIVLERLRGRVAVVTGGGAGIGRASCIRLSREGAAVVVADIDSDAAQSVAALIRSRGGQAEASLADVSNEASIAAMIAIATEKFGRLDILHNNAALVSSDATAADGDVTGMKVDVWDAVMAVNLRGPMLGCKHAIPEMIKSGGGAIINTSSGASQVGGVRLSAYSASKAGLNSLTRSVARQYGQSGIRCNAVLPGVIVKPKFSDDFLKASLRRVSTPYLGQPEDVAAYVAFLASDEARYVTGQLITIDGGVSAR